MLAVPHMVKHHKHDNAWAAMHRAYVTAHNQAVADRIKQTQCVAEAVYFEARGEPKMVQTMVADVVMNRTTNPKFPDTPCDVVHERRGDVCQFSWNCSHHMIANWKAWGDSMAVAQAAMIRKHDHSHGAMYFRTHRAKFRGMKPLRVTAKSRKMIFLAVR